MGVYINGMDVPPNCWWCPVKFWNDTEYICPFSHKHINSGDADRHDDCPLIHVPDYGDLIDWDALIEEAKILGTVTCHQPFDFPYGCNLVEWCKVAETVIPAERSEE